MKLRLVVPTRNCEDWDQEGLRCTEETSNRGARPSRHDPTWVNTFANPIPPLEVAVVLREKGKRHDPVVSTVMQGASDVHPESQF